MFMISMVFIHVYTQTSSSKQKQKLKVIYFNMHHTSTCVLLLLLSLCDMRTDSNFDAFIQKQRQKKQSCMQKDGNFRIPDNALERKLQFQQKGAHFFCVAVHETKQIKNENGFVFAPIFPSLFTFNVCNIKKRIDFYVSENVRKKAASAERTKAINDNMWV